MHQHQQEKDGGMRGCMEMMMVGSVGTKEDIRRKETKKKDKEKYKREVDILLGDTEVKYTRTKRVI